MCIPFALLPNDGLDVPIPTLPEELIVNLVDEAVSSEIKKLSLELIPTSYLLASFLKLIDACALASADSTLKAVFPVA